MSELSKAVFLSYASQDADAARKICETLRGAGIEVWLDQSELVGGDAWDAKIRGQIATCALFVPVVSAATQARREGYFRLEWKLADERTHLMAEGTPFLLPVVIDDTKDREALVPKSFLGVQWTRLRQAYGGQARDETSLEAFCARVKTLLESDGVARAFQRVEEREQTRSKARATTKRTRWLVPAILVLAVAGAVVLWQPWKSSAPTNSNPKLQTQDSEPSRSPPANEKSIAVLPFANISADKESTEYFSDGITEEILNALDRIPALRVTPRTSSFFFKGKNVALDEIGRTLRVASVIEGSVRKAGDRVKITVKLLNAADGSRVWAEEFDRDMTPTDLFAVQGEIAAKVAQKLGGTISAAASIPTAGALTKNSEAYDLYLQARALQTGPEIRATILETIRLYEAAVQSDPGYALAWARLSQAIIRARGFDAGGGARRSRIKDAAETALRLAPELPEAHLAMAMVSLNGDRDHEAAQRELNEAERRRPNDPEIFAARAQLEFARGKWGPALAALILRSVELDPQNVRLFDVGSRILIDIGRFAEAEQLTNRWSTLAPTLERPLVVRAENHLAWTGDRSGTLAIIGSVSENHPFHLELRAEVRAGLGDFVSAIADYERLSSSARSGRVLFGNYRTARFEARLGHATRADQLLAEALTTAQQRANDFPDTATPLLNLALIQAARGEKNKALATITESMRIVTRNRHASDIADVRTAKAEMHTVLGEKEAAIAELRAVHEMGYGFGYRLRVGVEWEPLRGEPKFQQLMKEAEKRADAQPRPKK